MFKKLALTLVFLFPLVSFAQTVPTNADILQRISVLEALVQNLQNELNALEAQKAVPVFGGISTTTQNQSISVYTDNTPFKNNAGDTVIPIIGTNCVRDYSRANPQGGSECGG